VRASVLCRLKVCSAPVKAKNKIAGEKKSPMYRCSSRMDFSQMPRLGGLALSVPSSDDSRLLSAVSDMEDSIVPIAFMWLLFAYLLDNCDIDIGMPYPVGPGWNAAECFFHTGYSVPLLLRQRIAFSCSVGTSSGSFQLRCRFLGSPNSTDTPNTKS
jgi:hypothetical protein